MLRRELEGVEKHYEHASKLAGGDFVSLQRKVNEIATAIVELTAESSRMESRLEGEEYEQSEDSSESLREEALEESYDGERYLEFSKSRSAFQKELAALEEANQENSKMKWAKSWMARD